MSISFFPVLLVGVVGMYSGNSAVLSEILYLSPINVGIITMSTISFVYYINQTQSSDLFDFILLSTLFVFTTLFFIASEMLTFFIFFELSVLPISWMIFKMGTNPERLSAMYYLVLYTTLASFPLLVNLVCVEQEWGSADVVSTPFLDAVLTPASTLWGVSMIGFGLAFLVKTPMYGVHLWLPKAHVEASTVGSMVLAGVLLKTGTMGLMVFSWSFNWFGYSVLLVTWLFLGLIISCIVCFRSGDVKIFIAYSSVAHMAITVMALVNLSGLSVFGVLLISIAHGFSSAGLFNAVNQFYNISGSRNFTLLPAIGSFAPMFSLGVLLLCLTNSSVPPSLSVWGEISVFARLVFWSPLVSFVFTAYVFLVGLYCVHLYLGSSHGHHSYSGVTSLTNSLSLNLSLVGWFSWNLLLVGVTSCLVLT